MEQLVDYSFETGTFDEVASLDVTVTYTEVLARFGRNERALKIVRSIVDVRDRKLGILDQRSIYARYLMGVLLNKVKRYE